MAPVSWASQTDAFVLFRFGWVDEHFAVIPRNTALSTCGQNRTGLVTWRAAVTQKFDVFCFNESGMTFSFYLFLQDFTTFIPLNKTFLLNWESFE